MPLLHLTINALNPSDCGRIAINPRQIVAVVDAGSFTEIWCTDSDQPFGVKEEYDIVIGLVENSAAGDANVPGPITIDWDKLQIHNK